MINLRSGDALALLTEKIANIAATELVESQGILTDTLDEYRFDSAEVVGDEHLNDCIAYLCSSGLAVYFISDDGLIVQLGASDGGA